MKYPGNITSKLPGMGTSIFAVMTQLAKEHNAINLAQGFPDFDISNLLIDKVYHYMKRGYNQYAPMPGVPALRNVISNNFRERYGLRYDPDAEVTITAGATQAIYTAISAIIRDEDEVIIIEPAYDSYAPSVRLNGGMVKYATLEPPEFRIDWGQLVRLITHRTRLIIINTPHNPTGSILSEDDLLEFERIVCTRDLTLLSDEVYEHLIYDGERHESVCRYPKLAQRSFVIGSFGKTVHATGWKTGFVLAPENLMSEFRKAHQFIVFSANTPIQHAIAEFMEDPENYRQLGKFYQAKRDLFAGLLQDSRFRILPSHGTYFQCVDYSEITDEPDLEFAKRLTREHGIAAIPLSPFYQKENPFKMLRFCFAKREETLYQAADILCKI